MVFSSVFFLFFFLPLVLLLYFSVPFKWKNTILLVFSLVFYAWGEPKYIILMFLSILINFGYGIWIEKHLENTKKKKQILTFAIVANIAVLGYFKYANFFVDIINSTVHTHIKMESISLPIGISFYTFHALSYLIDVYRRKENAQRNLFDLSLYITFFPQLVAGPIIRYNAVAEQLKKRVFSSEQFAQGIQRFILGLSKKILLANTFGSVADNVFATNPGDLSSGTAWLGIIAYTLQIYFDFSGYSDMAIGLGKMFGFEFAENFNYPYISQSISEFWRRWHISLGSWFRDYVYIPLGGSRTDAKWKVYRNLFIVWALTGFWHGASWTFIAWGTYYGILIALEKAGFEKFLFSLLRPLAHAYVLIAVMIGWVFFRADNFSFAAQYLGAMFSTHGADFADDKAIYLLSTNWMFYLVGIIVATPIFPKIQEISKKIPTLLQSSFAIIFYFALLSQIIMYLVNSTYNPFLYFRF